MYQRILVPVDGSETSTTGLYEALKLARLTHARLRLVHVIDELSLAKGSDAYGAYAREWVPMLKKAGEKVLEDARAMATAADVQVETLLVETVSERVSAVIVREAQVWNAELIVIGTHGRRGVRRLVLGSDAEQVLRSAPVPVLLIREGLGAPSTPA